MLGGGVESYLDTGLPSLQTEPDFRQVRREEDAALMASRYRNVSFTNCMHLVINVHMSRSAATTSL